MDKILTVGIAISFLVSFSALLWLVLRTFTFGKPELKSKAQGDVKKGICYAFVQGMMPWEKESAKRHLITYFSGFLYHGGIFLAIFYVFTLVFNIALPSLILLGFQIVIPGAAAAGIGLFIKRNSVAYMRSISTPDDYAANLLVDVFLILAFLHSLMQGVRPILLIITIIMFLYIPLGKIRHCFFFFYSRILFGLFFGRRGVFPRKQNQRRIEV